MILELAKAALRGARCCICGELIGDAPAHVVPPHHAECCETPEAATCAVNVTTDDKGKRRKR